MMINKIILIILSIFIVGVYSKTTKQLQSDVSLIVNLYNNNKYNKGSPCGASELTCNNIEDALAYFENIATSQPAHYPQSLIYQKLNLILADGVYYQNGSLQLYQYNVTVTTLESNVGVVIFDGSNNQGSALPIFSVNVTANEDDGKYSSYVEVSNIQFQNYNQSSIVFVQAPVSYTNITFSKCSFKNINLVNTSDSIGISSIFNVNQFTGGQTPPTAIFNSFIIIEYSTFDSPSILLPSNGGLVNCYNSVLLVRYTYIHSITTGSLFRGAYSNIVLEGNTIANVTSSIALIYSFNSFGYYVANDFASNNASTLGVGGAVLTFVSLYNNKYTFTFRENYVFNNTGYNSMITSNVEGSHPFEIPRNFISNSSFVNNTFTSNEVDIVNSVFACSVDFVLFDGCTFETNSKTPYQYDIISSIRSNVTFSNSVFSPSSATCSGVTSFIQFVNSPTAENLKLSCFDYCMIESDGFEVCNGNGSGSSGSSGSSGDEN